ncbi:FtsK/SpoIIIE domain-containing protein [Alicyclobacillus cycloheptanicus]|uniref:FtsK/SpoIIIE domain-containing protein n=1 Tax=Alicyclobacillus cycloheptanicus TaxID=1457 RepID=UPI0027D80054|nr:FtsK/SpoIIIE domain-containing protein [Alicyclobacillus cycloheptanicus]
MGITYVLRFPFGKTFADVTRKADAISTALCADVSLHQDGGYLILDIPQYPLSTFISYPTRILNVTRGTWRVPVGLSPNGWTWHDFDVFPHLLIAGPTRGGKTVLLKSIITTLLLSHSATDIELIGVDMKPQSLAFRKFGPVWTSLVDRPEAFVDVIQDAIFELEKRADKLAKAGCESVQEYEETTGHRFPRRFIIVDEYGRSFGSPCEDEIATGMMQLTAMGAGLGIHVILATQRPDAEIINGKIRANLESVVCFRVANGVQSRVILGHEGAETLPKIRGRAIYSAGDETVLQVPYISDKTLQRLLSSRRPARGKHGNGEWKTIQARSLRVGEDL